MEIDWKQIVAWLKKWRDHVIIVVGLIFGLPILWIEFEDGTPLMSRTIFVCYLMAVYWMTEALPIAVTALFPVILFPFMGVLEADKVSSAYYSDTIFLFIGSLVAALVICMEIILIGKAMEKWELHRRIALTILCRVGNRPRALLLAFMGATAFLSMWMSNTSTASLMVPLVMTTLRQLKGENVSSSSTTERNKKKPQSEEKSSLLAAEDNGIEMDKIEETPQDLFNNSEYTSSEEVDQPATIENPMTDKQKECINQYALAVLLGICYSASIGGTSTITGTGPNLIFKSQLEILFPDAPEVTFLQWSLFALPCAFVFLLLLWMLLCFLHIKEPSQLHFQMEQFHSQLKQMGKTSWPEMVVLADLGLMVLLWCTRIGLGTGWGSWFDEMPGDGTVAVLLSALLFIIPANFDGHTRVMDWESVRDFPWNIILLLGGGFALAKGITASGLSVWVGQTLQVLDALHVVLIVFLIITILTFSTELTSNVAIANICLPILGALSLSIGENPLLLMVPGTIATSYAFMLPVATPPNAIVFSSGEIRIIDMAKTGFFTNITGLILLTMWTFAFGLLVFDISLGDLPDWAEEGLKRQPFRKFFSF